MLVGPTSAGKIMTWMFWAALQASLPKKEKMLVICPLVAIKEFFAKAKEYLIPSHYWGSGNDLLLQRIFFSFCQWKIFLEENSKLG